MLNILTKYQSLARPMLLQTARATPTVFSTQMSSFSTSSYLEKQKKLGRPVSPHVTIYAFPLAAISSVTTRITGGLLTIGMYGTGLAALLGTDCAAMFTSLGSSGVGPVVKLCVAFPLAYHFAGGLRHLYWDRYPDGLNSETQYQSAVAIFAVSGVVSLVAMVM